MADRVWMAHPDLPGQRIRVRPEAVGVYQSSGWLPEADKAPEPVVETPAETPAAARRRQRIQPSTQEKE